MAEGAREEESRQRYTELDGGGPGSWAGSALVELRESAALIAANVRDLDEAMSFALYFLRYLQGELEAVVDTAEEVERAMVELGEELLDAGEFLPDEGGEDDDYLFDMSV